MRAQRKRLTQLQQQFVDYDLPDNAYVVFPTGIFKSDVFKKWKKSRRAKIKERLRINLNFREAAIW